MIKVDLNTRILPKRHEIFFARPGKEYRLYQEFIANEVVLVDLPNLGLRSGVPLREQGLLNRRIHRSRQLKSWCRHRQDKPRPSNDLDDYNRHVADAGVSQIRSVLTGYFERAKKGDLVLVVSSSYFSLAYLGEFIGDPTEIVQLKIPRLYADDSLQGRRVKWLAKIEKRFLDATILEIVKKPNIFVTLPRSVRRELYELVYNGYTFDGAFSARFDVTVEEFKSYDDLLIQSFFNFVAVNTRAIAEGRRLSGIKEAAFLEAGAYTPELRADVSSPGFLNLFSPQITPLVIAALLAIAIYVGPEAFSAAESGTLRIGNSQAPADDACVADVQEQAINQIRLSGADGWAEACERARQAAARTGIKGPARISR